MHANISDLVFHASHQTLIHMLCGEVAGGREGALLLVLFWLQAFGEYKTWRSEGLLHSVQILNCTYAELELGVAPNRRRSINRKVNSYKDEDEDDAKARRVNS